MSYGCDRSGLAALLEDELSAAPWTQGESDEGPVIEVKGRTLECPPSGEDLDWLREFAMPAPYGRGEHTLLDPAVRDALQVETRHIMLTGPAWEGLRTKMLTAVAVDMGLGDAGLRLIPLKLLIYRVGGHFSMHSDTEKTPGMVGSLALIVPGGYKGGALTIDHAEEKLAVGAGGARGWRWVAWYADCRHCLEEVKDGVRIAVTFSIAIDPETPLTRREPSRHQLSWALWRRSYAEWHTAWAARGGRNMAGREQYGHKMVWVLSHRYTEPGLRASLLKGRDRELARLIVDEPHGEACYLGWLQIRQIGSARTATVASWKDDRDAWCEPETDLEDDPPPASLRGRSWYLAEDPAPTHIAHRDTPELHLTEVARHNMWIEGLRSLGGEEIDHGAIEVLDGEIVPPGALANAVPEGARVYEATGNEGASLELQYRRAVIVMWRRNEATLEMLARCGGRLALSVEVGQRSEGQGSGEWRRTRATDVMDLWNEALKTDGGGPEPRAHRLVLEAMDREQRSEPDERLREGYVKKVAAIDLEAEAVPTLVGWIRDQIQMGKPMDAWVRALRPACGEVCGRDAMSGAPALLRALCETPETQDLAVELVAVRDDAPATSEAVLRHAEVLEEGLAEQAWRRRRDAKITMDERGPRGDTGA